MRRKMYKSEVKAAMHEIINDTGARTSFQDSQKYVTFLILECVLLKIVMI